MNQHVDHPPIASGLPAFVTHEPDGAEARDIKTLYALALSLDNEFVSAQAWIDNELVRAYLSRTITLYHSISNDSSTMSLSFASQLRSSLRAMR